MYLLSTFFIFIIHSFLFYFYHFSLSNFCFIPFIIFLVIPTCHWVVLLIDRCLLPLSLSLSLSRSLTIYISIYLLLSLCFFPQSHIYPNTKLIFGIEFNRRTVMGRNLWRSEQSCQFQLSIPNLFYSLVKQYSKDLFYFLKLTFFCFLLTSSFQ